MQIFVKTLTNRTFTLDVESYESIMIVKQKLEAIEPKVTVASQTLVYEGDTLASMFNLIFDKLSVAIHSNRFCSSSSLQ